MSKQTIGKPYFLYKVLGLVLLLIGIVFLGVGTGFVIHDLQLDAHYLIQGEITGFGNNGTYISYSVDGRNYESKVNYKSSFMRTGDTISIYYNPKNPKEISVKMPVFTYVFLGIGIVMTVIGTVLLFIRGKRIYGRKRLIEEGYCVKAQITEICLNRTIQYNNKNPYYILCRYTDETGTVHEYRSDAILINPEGLLLSDSVLVYLDRDNPKRYYVDIDQVIKKIVVH